MELNNLTNYSNEEIIKIIENINKYKLELRNNINKPNITFGIEIESEFSNVKKIEQELTKLNISNWDLKDDYTLDDGIEISSPILEDNTESYEEIKKVCNIFKRNAKIGAHTGGHIHIGSQILEKEINLKNLINLWILYEHIIYRFTNGEFLNIRPSGNTFASPLRSLNLPNYNYTKYNNLMIDSCIRILNISNYKKKLKRNTIEFRSPNGSFEPVIWQNNLNLFVKMIEKSKILDVEKLYYDNYDNLKISPKEYYNIYLNDAIKFADLIFDDNIDKLYFLRQYLKNNETSYKYIKAKTFVK